MRGILREILSVAGHEVSLVPDGEAALHAIEVREPDLLILDQVMPGLSGLEVCRILKGNPFTAGIPVLMLTGQGGVEHRIAGFEAGADDYLPKPFDARELRSRADALLRLVRRESDRNPTSGLPGSRAIHDEIERRTALRAPFAMCYLDLDHFKAFADTFGFTIADQVIRELGAALRDLSEEAADGSFVGHIGGDDFLVICEPQDAERIAYAAADRFRAIASDVIGDEAVKQGSFRAADRDGVVRDLPVARLSGAILQVRSGEMSLARLGTLAAEVKRRTKARGAGTILVEAV